MKTHHCDECQHHRYETRLISKRENLEGDFLCCKKGHKPRFYAPKNGNVYSSDWGYKRRCSDFVVGEHVHIIRENVHITEKANGV